MLMTVLHLTTFLQGGAGLVIAEMAAAQRAAGHDVVVVTSATPEPGYGNYPGHLETLGRAGVELYLVDSLFKREIGENLNVVTFLAGEGGGAARFDIVHAHAAVPAVIGMILASRSGRRAPVLQTMHGWGTAKTVAQEQCDLAVLNLVDRVVVAAETSAAFLHSLGVAAERVRVIPYGVAPRRLHARYAHPVEAEMLEWQRNGGAVACCSGTIGQRKNQRLLVDALPLLDADHRVLCVFVGEGDTTELRAHAAELGVADHVRFCGYREDARDIAAGADCLVLPSLSEGQPVSILEAFCDGLTVVASGIPEIKEIVDDEVTGFLFDPSHAADLARALTAAHRLTRDERENVRARAQQVYESRFSVDRMVREYLAEYDALCSSR
jgi:glycosyltransferase involved in cell wall biosynthesis